MKTTNIATYSLFHQHRHPQATKEAEGLQLSHTDMVLCIQHPVMLNHTKTSQATRDAEQLHQMCARTCWRSYTLDVATIMHATQKADMNDAAYNAAVTV